MYLRLFAIARRMWGKLEFYVSIGNGASIGWTDDLAYAYSTFEESEAETVLKLVFEAGNYDAHIHVFRRELNDDPPANDP